MPTIHCKAQLSTVASRTILLLPKPESAKLPSRGLVLVEGTMNGFRFHAPAEPDGRGSHWFYVEKPLEKGAKTKAGDTVTLEIDPMKVWPEPTVPEDLKKALAGDKRAQEIWLDVSTKAHWDWIRWVRSTNNPETRKIRIIKTLSKLKSGTRSPCCFNRSACTDMEVSKGGILLAIH